MGFFMGVNTDYPSISSYAEAKAFHDATKINRHGNRWPSQTKVKHMFTCNGDESIAFKLYDTECVTYHPDGSLTIQGYGTTTTSQFIDRLTPLGVRHECHQRSGRHGPMLMLQPVCEHVDPPNQWHDEERRWTGVDWGEGVVIKCEFPVTINYSADRGHHMPVGDVPKFNLPSINRAAARQAAKEYQLADFERAARAYVVLQRIRSHQGESMWTVANALREGRLGDACKGVPVGGTTKSYGQRWGGPGQVDPGFFRELRDWIYDHEGVVENETLQFLTMKQYERYLKMTKRF
jgi:hypothetical protein